MHAADLRRCGCRHGQHNGEGRRRHNRPYRPLGSLAVSHGADHSFVGRFDLVADGVCPPRTTRPVAAGWACRMLRSNPSKGSTSRVRRASSLFLAPAGIASDSGEWAKILWVPGVSTPPPVTDVKAGRKGPGGRVPTPGTQGRSTFISRFAFPYSVGPALPAGKAGPTKNGEPRPRPANPRTTPPIPRTSLPLPFDSCQ